MGPGCNSGRGLTHASLKLVQSILGHGIAGNSVIVIQSAGKLFVGEIIKLGESLTYNDLGFVDFGCHPFNGSSYLNTK